MPSAGESQVALGRGNEHVPTKGTVQVKLVRVNVNPMSRVGVLFPLALLRARQERSREPDLVHAEQVQREAEENGGDEQIDPGIGGKLVDPVAPSSCCETQTEAGKSEDDSSAIHRAPAQPGAGAFLRAFGEVGNR